MRAMHKALFGDASNSEEAGGNDTSLCDEAAPQERARQLPRTPAAHERDPPCDWVLHKARRL